MGLMDNVWGLGRRRVRRSVGREIVQASRGDYLARKECARKLVLERIAHFNQSYKFVFNRVAIRNQATRWGSCSSAGNLNFNYRVVYLSADLVDYLVVHELCHLYEFNHSAKFWKLVEQTLPNYRDLRTNLRKIDLRKLGGS